MRLLLGHIVYWMWQDFLDTLYLRPRNSLLRENNQGYIYIVKKQQEQYLKKIKIIELGWCPIERSSDPNLDPPIRPNLTQNLQPIECSTSRIRTFWR